MHVLVLKIVILDTKVMGLRLRGLYALEPIHSANSLFFWYINLSNYVLNQRSFSGAILIKKPWPIMSISGCFDILS